MHSRIFKLQNDLTQDFEAINEIDFEENGFLDGFHDYVADRGEKDWLESYNWLISCFGEVFKDFHKKDEYYYVNVYKDDLEAFLESQKNKIINEVSKPIDEIYWYGVSLYVNGDDSGFYFYHDNTYYTDVEFAIHLYRWYFKNKNEEVITFRLEGALDYHS